jgi:Xaa-Pro aminopeptidase
MTKDIISKLPLTDFGKHRTVLFTKMPINSIALFPAAAELTRSNDTEYPFCQNKNFFYLTGFNEPDALLVLLKVKVAKKSQYCFRCQKIRCMKFGKVDALVNKKRCKIMGLMLVISLMK